MRGLAGIACAALLLLGVVACQKADEKAPPPPPVTEPGNVSSEAPPTAAAVAPENAQAFYARFRTAVLNDDRAAIESLVRFPFKTRGTTDDDPEVTHEQKDFWPVYTRVLAQETGYGDGLTQRQYIEKNAELPPEALGGDKTVPVAPDATQFRVGALEFEKSGDQWYWVSAYLEE